MPAIGGSITAIVASAIFAKYGLGYTVRGVCQLAILMRICGSVIGEIAPAMLDLEASDRGFKQRFFFFVGIAVLYTGGSMVLTLCLTTFVSNLVQRGRSTYEFSLLVRW